MSNGMIEVVTRYFVSGWAVVTQANGGIVLAECAGRYLGVAIADIERPDLADESRRLRAFVIPFHEPLAAGEIDGLAVRSAGSDIPLSAGRGTRKDTREALQVFVFGSPRSGTSEIGATIAKQLDLAWLGEGHWGPAFAAAARALEGDARTASGIGKFAVLSRQGHVIHDIARKGYYSVHGSARFIDKTPGVPMINSAKFLFQCFPSGKFIFLYRSGISNVLSRMAKFGGSFEAHCRDWAAAMDSWLAVRDFLPHYLEIRQEDMLNSPEAVARSLADYLGCPEAEAGIADSLRHGSLERTGAGLGKALISETGWSAAQADQFRTLCGSTMARWGYPLDQDDLNRHPSSPLPR